MIYTTFPTLLYKNTIASRFREGLPVHTCDANANANENVKANAKKNTREPGQRKRKCKCKEWKFSIIFRILRSLRFVQRVNVACICICTCFVCVYQAEPSYMQSTL